MKVLWLIAMREYITGVNNRTELLTKLCKRMNSYSHDLIVNYNDETTMLICFLVIACCDDAAAAVDVHSYFTTVISYEFDVGSAGEAKLCATQVCKVVVLLLPLFILILRLLLLK